MNTAQWLVTDGGIEGAGDYHGYKARLGERRRGSDGALIDWPLHLAAKSGINLPDFKRAFLEAVERHQLHIKEPFSRDILRQSFADALRFWRSSKIHSQHCREIKRKWFPERSELMALSLQELDDVCNAASRRMLAEGWVPNGLVPADDESRAARREQAAEGAE